jgi:hypothetical protein
VRHTGRVTWKAEEDGVACSGFMGAEGALRTQRAL